MELLTFLTSSLRWILHYCQKYNIEMPEKDKIMEMIENLLPILSIEGDTFDFKGNILDKRFEELYNDFCAMSKSLGGTIVLGIREPW